MLETFNYTLIHPAAKPPFQAVDSIGYDLCSVEDIIVPSARVDLDAPCLVDNDWHTNRLVTHESIVISTGLVISFEGSYGAFIWNRSGLSLKGLSVVGFAIEDGPLVRLAGCIEGTYRGEYKVVMVNVGSKDYKINVGDKIAQVVFQRVESPIGILVKIEDHLSTQRGTSGFGGTGR